VQWARRAALQDIALPAKVIILGWRKQRCGNSLKIRIGWGRVEGRSVSYGLDQRRMKVADCVPGSSAASDMAC
jgi:hypothetical protein